MKRNTIKIVNILFMVSIIIISGLTGCLCDGNSTNSVNVNIPQNKSLLLISTDAGESWTSRETGTDKKFYNVSYAYINTGYRIVLSGENGAIYSTPNLGVSFTSPAQLTTWPFYGAAFSAADDKIILTSGEQQFVTTTNGGDSWFVRSAGNLNISYLDINPAITQYYAACSTGDPKNIYITTNNGINWQVKTANPENTDEFGGIKYIRGNILIAYGNNGLIMRSTNYGENWSRVNTPSTDRITSLAVNPEYEIIVSNTNTRNKYLRSTDLGINWELKDINTNTVATPTLFTISYDGIIFGAGAYGVMAKSTDMGETWRKIQSGTEAKIQDIIYINNSLMAAVAYK